jgi:Tol biopolymer transport system component
LEGGIPTWSSHPSWSPDGSRIAFAGPDPTNQTNSVDIYVAAVDGEGGLRKLTDDQGTDEGGCLTVPG